MSRLFSPITLWWDGREPRERVLLAVLGGLVSIFLIIFIVILPVRSTAAAADAQLARAEAELRLVSRLAPAAGPDGIRTAFERSVLISIARDQNIKLTSVQPGPDGTITVRVDNVQTLPLYDFFEALVSGYAVTLDRVQVTADGNGRLSAQFTVR